MRVKVTTIGWSVGLLPCLLVALLSSSAPAGANETVVEGELLNPVSYGRSYDRVDGHGA